MSRKRLIHGVVGGLLALGLAGSAHAGLYATYQAGPIMYPGANPDYPQQAAVNKNIGSPYYGYLYIADYRNAAGVDKYIHIWKPVNMAEGTGATAYENTGLSIAPAGTGQFDPFGVAVGADDTVWIGEPSTGQISAAPPVPPSGTRVTAVPQITGVGFVRGLYVRGTIDSMQIWAAGSDFVAKYSGSAPSWDVPGSFGEAFRTTGLGLNSGPYGPSADLDGNVYVVTKTTSVSGVPAFIKLDPTGAIVPFAAVIPDGYTTSDLSSTGFVEDKTYPGGGYLYSINRTATATNGGDIGIRYDLSGTYLDGYGPARDPAPVNYSVVALTRNNTYGTTDDLGNVIQKVSVPNPPPLTGSNGGYQKVIKRAPFLAPSFTEKSAGASVKSSPTAVDGVVYFGADDGKLYAYTTVDGNPVAGFPVDISAYVGASVQLLGRPAVYFGTGGKAIYLTTSRGDVVKVNPDGTPAWKYSNMIGSATPTATTPAVTAAGEVFAALNLVEGASVIKLAEADGSFLNKSAVLAPVTGNISNPAVELDGAKVYVGTQSGVTGDLWLLSGANLTVLTSFAMGEGVAAPPHVKGPDAYVGTLAGKLYKVNSANSNLDANFGTAGAAVIGEPIVTDAFPHLNALYVGTDKGKLWRVDPDNGAASVAYDTTDATAVLGGLVVNPESGTIAFGTSKGVFYQVPAGVNAAQVFQGYGAITGTPGYDRATQRFLVGSDDQNVYAFSSR